EGNVRLERGADVVEGTHLQYNLGAARGAMKDPVYTLHRSRPLGEGLQVFREVDGRGAARRLLFEGPGRYRAEQARYTTCGPEHEDWHLRAGRLDIDQSRDLCVARNASVVFK